MKRITIIMTTLILLAACQKESHMQQSPQESVVTYNVTAPVEFEIKSAGEASAINILWYGVYHKKADGTYKYMSDMSAFVEVTNPASIEVPVTLIKDQVYRLVFVAQHRILSQQKASEEYVYNVDESGDMKFNPDVIGDITSGEQLDAFVYLENEIGPITGNENRDITLQRPVAQLNLATSKSVTKGTDLSITLTGAPASYNLFTKTYSQETATPVTFDNLKVTGDSFTVNGTDYNRLEILYLLGGNKVQATVTTGTGATATETTISGIVTAPNYKTNIVGEI